MFARNRRYHGFLWADLAAALAVLALILAGFALSLDGFRRFNHYQLVRQRCIAAAQAQIDSIAATAQPIPQEELERLWPSLKVSLHETPGNDQWQNLKLVNVTVTAMSLRKHVKVTLGRYVPTDRPTSDNPPGKTDLEGGD